MTIYPDKFKPTIVKWNENGIQKCFDCTYKFTEAVVFLQLDLVVVFKKESSNQTRSVACVYNMDGKYLYEILFPVLDSMSRHITVSYIWSSEIKKGIKIVYGTNAVSYRDFSCDFDFIRREYIATNEAR